jgi:NodT family efflux transporter outer membrane factor (OMF) lipoprotein
MSILIRPLCVSALAALLCSCAAVGPDFATPAPPPASAYTAPGEAAPAQAAVGAALAADWWSLFRSPEIDAVVKEAAAGNPSLQAARERLGQARETVLANPGPLQGELTAGAQREHINLAGYGFSGFPGIGAIPNPTVNLYSVGASVRYGFDLWGARRREVETRQARAEAQAAELDAAYLTLTGQVVTQSLTIASMKAQIEAAEELGREDQALVDLSGKAVQGGSGTQLDIVTAQAQLAADEATIPAMRQQLAVARHALALLVGRSPSEWTPPDFSLERIALPAEIPVSLPSQLARSRPDIHAAEARLHAATAQIGVAEAKLYPDVSLSANLTQGALEPDKIFSSDFSGWSIGPLGFTLPLLDRGALHAQSRAAKAATRAAAQDYRSTVLSAFGQVADVLQALQNDQVTLDAQDRALKIAAESLRLNRLRYQGGKSGIEPVTQAQRTYQRARVLYLRARTQLYLDTAQLFLATGGGWKAPGGADGGQSAAPAAA